MCNLTNMQFWKHENMQSRVIVRPVPRREVWQFLISQEILFSLPRNSSNIGYIYISIQTVLCLSPKLILCTTDLLHPTLFNYPYSSLPFSTIIRTHLSNHHPCILNPFTTMTPFNPVVPWVFYLGREGIRGFWPISTHAKLHYIHKVTQAQKGYSKDFALVKPRPFYSAKGEVSYWGGYYVSFLCVTLRALLSFSPFFPIP